MAEPLQILEPTPIRTPIQVIFESDGSVLIWADPNEYNVQITNGRGGGPTGQLRTKITVIPLGPWRAPNTQTMGPAHSRDTDIQKSP